MKHIILVLLEHWFHCFSFLNTLFVKSELLSSDSLGSDLLPFLWTLTLLSSPLPKRINKVFSGGVSAIDSIPFAISYRIGDIYYGMAWKPTRDDNIIVWCEHIWNALQYSRCKLCVPLSNFLNEFILKLSIGCLIKLLLCSKEERANITLYCNWCLLNTATADGQSHRVFMKPAAFFVVLSHCTLRDDTAWKPTQSRTNHNIIT
jgi:hypothetical protein